MGASKSRNIVKLEQSLMQSRWVMPIWDEQRVANILQKHDVPEMIARLLDMRGIDEREVERFLNPTLTKDFPDPFEMAGMSDMAEYMAKAIRSGKKIGIFGDFDVDGATSTAIIKRFLAHLGINAPFYIPDRIKEGYGPNIKALESLKEQGADIVAILDCGITAHDIIGQGRDMGLEIVVFDHHESEETLPPANHVINPKRKDDNSGYDMLAACGVTFMACVAMNTKLRESGYYKDNNMAEPPLRDWMDILALGTVCDMVPLLGPNRLFVKYGFKRMAQNPVTGIAALCQSAGLNEKPNAYHAGFILGPRINAGSRVHKAHLGAELLSIDDRTRADEIVAILEQCNDKRKDIEAEMIDSAVQMIEAAGMEKDPVIIVGHEDWHPGLSGLVAGRIKERFGRPAAVITYAPGLDGELEGRGSARSVPGVNIGAAFIDARNKGLLRKGGGHAMAAGFSVSKEQESDFKQYLRTHIETQMAGQEAFSETVLDDVLTTNGATPALVNMLIDNFGPFGQGHEEPVFMLQDVRLYDVRVVGKDHISARVSDWEGGKQIKAIAFRVIDTAMGEAILKNWQSQPFHLIGTLNIDRWNGQENVQLMIKDAALALAGAAQDRKFA